MEFEKSAYGLGDAPLRWFQRVCAVLKDECKMHQNSYDPCQLSLFKNGKLVCALTVHVDDLLVIGDDHHMLYVRQQLQKVFGELSVEENEFVHLGCELKRDRKNNTLNVSLERFCKSVPLIDFPTGRIKQVDSSTTEQEKQKLMSGNSALGWASRMVRMDISYDVSVLQSCVNTSTVKDLKYYNVVAKRVIQSASDSYLLYTIWKHDVSHGYMQIITDASFLQP